MTLHDIEERRRYFRDHQRKRRKRLRKPPRVAAGTPIVNRIKGKVLRDLRRANIAFPEEMFSELRADAIKAGTSFSAQVLLRVEWGLDV
jgi:hypothetical protein